MNCEKCGNEAGPVLCNKCRQVLRGKIIGRPRRYSVGGKSIAEISRLSGVSAGTVKRFLDGKIIKNKIKLDKLSTVILGFSVSENK